MRTQLSEAGGDGGPDPAHRAGDHDPPARKCIVAKLGFHASSLSRPPTGRLQSYVLVPQVGVLGDESAQQLDALGVVQHHDLDAQLSQPLVAAGEVGRFADHHGPDAELTHQPAAIPARRKRGHHYGLAVVTAPAGVAKGARFGVGGSVAILDPTVVAPAEQLAGPVEKGGPDGYAALVEPETRLLDRHRQHGQSLVPPYRFRVWHQDGLARDIGPYQPIVLLLEGALVLRKKGGKLVRTLLDLLSTMGSVNYREATALDAEQIAHLHADSWRRHYRGAYSDAYLDGDVFEDRRQLWLERFQRPDDESFTIVAELDREVVGVAHTCLDRDPEWGALLDNLHVRFELKRQGVGRALVTETAAVLWQRRPSSGLYLWVLEQNTAAQAFYSAMGGVVVEDRLGGPFPGGGRAPVLRYAWPDTSVLHHPNDG